MTEHPAQQPPAPSSGPSSGIDRSDHGITQLRVHGVSGTPASSMLAHPADLLVRVEGDDRAGFYRRWYPGGTSPDSDAGRVEAYSWGGLTSGPATRALWLLFLPFVLVDLAHWMLPPVSENRRSRTARLASTVLRLLALSLTFTFLEATVVVALDLGAWQCAPVDRCASRFAPLDWISGLDPGQRLAIAALLPAAVVVILWRLGRQNLRLNLPVEGIPTPPGPAVGASSTTPLAAETFWNGDVSELRLRAVHIAGWCSALGALVLAATLRAASTSLGTSVVAFLLVLHLSVLGACIGVTCSERVTGRGGDGTPKATRPLLNLRWGSVILLATGLVVTAFVPATWPAPGAPPTHLPGLRGALLGTFYVQLALLVVLFALVAVQRPWAIGRGRPGFGVALRGFAAPATAFSAWLVAVTFSVGLGLATARRLGTAVTSTAVAQTNAKDAADTLANPAAELGKRLDALQGDASLIVPPGYFWTGTAVVIMLVALVLVVLGVVVHVVRATRRSVPTVLRDYGGQEAPGRAKAVARGRVLAGLTDDVDQILGPLLLVAALEVVVGSTLYLVVNFDSVESDPRIKVLTALGVWLTGLAALGLVSLGFLAFRNAQVRRYVGILWDVATFWPRANHPLTPPCYGERAVPELRRRTSELTSAAGDVVVLSAHSQGSVLGAAVLMKPLTSPGRVVLLTYGSPLRRLYARFFPSYFGPGAFQDTLDSTDGRWVNLWARSDPIGAWVGIKGSSPDRPDVDTMVIEPESLLAGSDGRPPPACVHSGYVGFPEYAAAVRALTGPGGTVPPPPRS